MGTFSLKQSFGKGSFLPRKTDASNPADWLWMAQADLDVVRVAVAQQIGFTTCRSKLAEALEKIMKGELIRLGWTLERTHDLERLLDLLVSRKSDLVGSLEPLCDDLAEAYFSDRYPGFDLDDPDWPKLEKTLASVCQVLSTVATRVVKK
jgi:HEPN domain-containing protein